MIARLFALVLIAAIVFGPVAARAEESQPTMLGMSKGEFAVGVAAVVTGLRVLVVLLVGSRFLGPSVGTGLLAIYLGHVVAEGVIYGASAGAGAYALGASADQLDGAKPPSILPQRLDTPVPQRSELPLELATEPSRP